MGLRTNNGPFNIFEEQETTIDFYDLDPMGVVWHGNYLKYFEIGRRILLEKIDHTYNDMRDSGILFPVVETSVKYIRSLYFLDKIRIKSILTEYENCFKIKFEIRDVKNGLLVTKGSSTQMAVNAKTGEACFVCPKDFIDKVEALIRKNNE